MRIASNKGNNLGKTSIPMKLNGTPVQALLDTGSTNSHVSEQVLKRLKLNVQTQENCIGLAIESHTSNNAGTCEIAIKLNGSNYANVCLSVLQELLTDVVLGQVFMQQHKCQLLFW